jgi:hypothetical protein
MVVSCAPMVCAAGDADVMSTPANASPLTTAAAVNLRNIPLRIENLLEKNCNCFSYVARVTPDSRTSEERVPFCVSMSDARATAAHRNAAESISKSVSRFAWNDRGRDPRGNRPAC